MGEYNRDNEQSPGGLLYQHLGNWTIEYPGEYQENDRVTRSYDRDVERLTESEFAALCAVFSLTCPDFSDLAAIEVAAWKIWHVARHAGRKGTAIAALLVATVNYGLMADATCDRWAIGEPWVPYDLPEVPRQRPRATRASNWTPRAVDPSGKPWK